MSQGGYGDGDKPIGTSARDHWLRITPEIAVLLDSDTPTFTDSEGSFVRLADYVEIVRNKPAAGVR